MLKIRNILLIGAISVAFSGCKKDEIQSEEVKINNKTAATAQKAINSVTMSNWMSAFSDQVRITDLSIPGTHNSAARIEYFPGTAECQDLSITDQLKAGVRYFDIRCRHIGNAFVIHHGEVYQKISFNDVLTQCLSFLKSNPSETILMSMKEEHTATGNTRSFEQTFNSYVEKNPSKWNLDKDLSKLGALRGKIKLIRRFSATVPKGVQATSWKNNTTFSINTSDASLKVQDYYKVTDIDSKWDDMKAMLLEAKKDTTNRLYINYGSGYKPLLFGIPSITKISNAINPKTVSFLNANKRGKYGVIALDFISSATSKLIVNSNF